MTACKIRAIDGIVCLASRQEVYLPSPSPIYLNSGILGSDEPNPLPKPFNEVEWSEDFDVVELTAQLISLLKPASRKNVIASKPRGNGAGSYIADVVKRMKKTPVYTIDFLSLYFACATEVLGEVTPVDCNFTILGSGYDDVNKKYLFPKVRPVYKAGNKMQKVEFNEEWKALDTFSIIFDKATNAFGEEVEARVLIDSVYIPTEELSQPVKASQAGFGGLYRVHHWYILVSDRRTGEGRTIYLLCLYISLHIVNTSALNILRNLLCK